MDSNNLIYPEMIADVLEKLGPYHLSYNKSHKINYFWFIFRRLLPWWFALFYHTILMYIAAGNIRYCLSKLLSEDENKITDTSDIFTEIEKYKKNIEISRTQIKILTLRIKNYTPR